MALRCRVGRRPQHQKRTKVVPERPLDYREMAQAVQQAETTFLILGNVPHSTKFTQGLARIAPTHRRFSLRGMNKPTSHLDHPSVQDSHHQSPRCCKRRSGNIIQPRYRKIAATGLPFAKDLLPSPGSLGWSASSNSLQSDHVGARPLGDGYQRASSAIRSEIYMWRFRSALAIVRTSLWENSDFPALYAKTVMRQLSGVYPLVLSMRSIDGAKGAGQC